MLIMGGINTEAKIVLDDFNLFDFCSETWLETIIIANESRAKFTPQCYYENDLNRKKDPCHLHERKLHKICAVWEQAFYNSTYKNASRA